MKNQQSKVTLILLALFLERGCSYVQFLDPPKVSIHFPEDIADVDFKNLTFASISNSYPVFDLICNASYPVEWVPIYNEDDDGTSEQKKEASTTRFALNFTNPETYMYSANISLAYNGKLFAFSNFSCRSTQFENLQTNVILIPKDWKNIILMNITSDPEYGLRKNKFHQPDQCKVYTSVSEINKPSSCWKCENSNGTDLELDFIGCNHPIECNSIYQRQNMGTRCLKDVEKTPKNDKRFCRRIGAYDYNPKTLVCKNFGPVLTQLYFFGVKKSPDIPPNIYFDWAKIDPQDMIYIQNSITTRDLFYGENITITCEMSKFYFSFGSWFALLSKNNIMSYYQTLNFIPEKQEWKGTFVSKFNLSLEYPAPSEVFCFAPVWNSSEWVNTSIKIVVRNGTAPEVISITDPMDKTFTIGERNRSLVCNYFGEPMPNIKWKGPEGGYFQIEENEQNYTSTLLFPEVTYTSSGEYECSAESFLGTNSKLFSVVTKQETSKSLKTIISVTAVCAVAILIVVGFIMVRLFRIIKSQREALRLLTEAEIKEFEDGNPEFVSKNQYFDRNLVIEALPYDKRYEVAPNSITIDKKNLLGSGAFGKVYKGKITKTSRSLNPPNSSKQAENSLKVTENEVVTTQVVAVKTCGTDVDIMYFKALLSEVKIMAFIGKHKNIISLIGAYTKDIRNRVCLVAVEFCPNGNLESFIRRQRSSFKNLVQYGMIVIGPTNDISKIQSDSITAVYSNVQVTDVPDIILSTIDLFKWTYDVACGMEFLHEKKIIHGDLANRNILLTEDLVAKIGDFGLARQLFENSNYIKTTQAPLPWRHLAPESLINLEFSLASDMWGVGVTIYEIFTLSETPYSGMTFDLQFPKKLEHGLRLNKPIFATNDLYEYMLKCWTYNPEGRPTSFDELKNLCVKSLDKFKTTNSEEDGYLKLCDPNKCDPYEDPTGYLVPNFHET